MCDRPVPNLQRFGASRRDQHVIGTECQTAHFASVRQFLDRRQLLDCLLLQIERVHVQLVVQRQRDDLHKTAITPSHIPTLDCYLAGQAAVHEHVHGADFPVEFDLAERCEHQREIPIDLDLLFAKQQRVRRSSHRSGELTLLHRRSLDAYALWTAACAAVCVLPPRWRCGRIHRKTPHPAEEPSMHGASLTRGTHVTREDTTVAIDV